MPIIVRRSMKHCLLRVSVESIQNRQPRCSTVTDALSGRVMDEWIEKRSVHSTRAVSRGPAMPAVTCTPGTATPMAATRMTSRTDGVSSPRVGATAVSRRRAWSRGALGLPERECEHRRPHAGNELARLERRRVHERHRRRRAERDDEAARHSWSTTQRHPQLLVDQWREGFFFAQPRTIADL